MIKKILPSIRKYFNWLNMKPDEHYIRRSVHYDATFRNYKRLWINILLFLVTVISTTVAGAESADNIGDIILSGLPFSLTLMAILFSHEMGHYLAARYFGVKATLPYFIPFPSIIGTMGAVIKLKSQITERRVLLYIGAMGPIAGFILSLIAAVIGIYLSEVKPIPVSTDGMTLIFGDSVLSSLITRIIHGEIPPGYDIYLSKYAWAGWIGFLITGLNLMPIGQLDGSRVIYSLLGKKQIYFGWAAFTGLIFLSFIWPGWIVWIIMALVFLRIAHPPIEDDTELSTGEKITGWICLAIFLLTFIPVPVNIF
jgi:membrane-associated protease RseP (regulator of RpoE activity)